MSVSETGVIQGKHVLVADGDGGGRERRAILLLAVGVLRRASGTSVASRGAFLLLLSELERQGPIPWVSELGASVSPGLFSGSWEAGAGQTRPPIWVPVLSWGTGPHKRKPRPSWTCAWPQVGRKPAFPPSTLPAHLVFGLSPIVGDRLPFWLQTFPGLAFSESPSDTENFGSQGLFIIYTAQ